MKLGKYATALVITSFLLTGCQSDSKTVKEDGKYVVASLENGKKEKNIFADDIFNEIISTASGKNSYFDAALQQLMDQKFPIDEDMETDANETVDQIEAYYKNQYGESAQEYLESALGASGFKSLDDYRENMVRVYQRCNFLLAYVEDNFDEVFNDYFVQASPRKASIIKVSMTDVENPTEEEQAKLNEVKALLNSSKSFGDIAKDYSDDTNTNKNKGKLGIVDTTSGLAQTFGSDVETKILALSKGETSEAVKGNDGYYFIKVTDTDKDSIKKEIKKDLSIDSPLISYDTYMSYLAFKSYNIKYDDKKTEEIINTVLDEALKEREASRGGNN